MNVTVIGAGLAGTEAAWQLAERGIEVTLAEMKPEKMSPAHHSPLLAELVCSNSLKADRVTNAVGLLKEEMRRMGSLIMEAADAARVPAGGALAVDREVFSRYITDKITSHPRITLVPGEVTRIPEGNVIIATGPLTSDAMSDAIATLPGMKSLHFYDAAAPIVTLDSLDFNKIFRQSRYDKGDDDYLNCPMTKEEYDAFVDALVSAETADVHGFEESMVYEGCMPVESMAKRGHMVLAYGPLKPVGLKDPHTGKGAYAVVQLRQDNAAGTLFNLVGFQTRLKWPEQKRVFGMIPGLENAEFARYGVMHRNTFLNSPGFLDESFRMIDNPNVYFAGQMTGVEGYVPSSASGLIAGLSMACRLKGRDAPHFPGTTAMGAMTRYMSTPNRDYQPMGCSFGLLDEIAPPEGKKKFYNKVEKYSALAERALAEIDAIAARYGKEEE